MRRLIILRPEPGASASLERARSLGLDAVSMPLFEVGPIAWTPPDPSLFDGVLATSANALRHGGAGLKQFRHLPLYAVGEATAEAAREAGFDNVAAGRDNVDALLGSIHSNLQLFHPCGRYRRHYPAERPAIRSLLVYAANFVPMPEGFASISGTTVAVHSPRAGWRLAVLADAAGFDRSSVKIAAISGAAARAGGSGWAEVASAAAPTDRALLELAARLCEKP